MKINKTIDELLSVDIERGGFSAVAVRRHYVAVHKSMVEGGMLPHIADSRAYVATRTYYQHLKDLDLEKKSRSRGW